MPHEVFISYRHEDKEWAGRICSALEARGIACWIAYRDIAPGADWPAEIMNGLKHSKFFAVILSSNSVNEEQISREVRIAADELKLRIFPIRIEDVQPPAKVGYFLGDIQWLDVFDGKFETAIDQLAARIRGAAVPPVAAPVHIGSPKTTPPRARGKSPLMLWIGVGVAALLIAAIAIAFAKRKPTVPDGVSQVAISFLNNLSRGDFQAAWDELTPTRRGQLKYVPWLKEKAAEAHQNGPFTTELRTCQALANGAGYGCDFKLIYENGKKTAPASLTVAKEANSGFGVEVEKHAKPQ
jgi:hypothetical protein